jgi:hypothetical protein
MFALAFVAVLLAASGSVRTAEDRSSLSALSLSRALSLTLRVRPSSPRHQHQQAHAAEIVDDLASESAPFTAILARAPPPPPPARQLAAPQPNA